MHWFVFTPVQTNYTFMSVVLAQIFVQQNARVAMAIFVCQMIMSKKKSLFLFFFFFSSVAPSISSPHTAALKQLKVLWHGGSAVWQELCLGHREHPLLPRCAGHSAHPVPLPCLLSQGTAQHPFHPCRRIHFSYSPSGKGVLPCVCTQATEAAQLWEFWVRDGSVVL